MPRSEAGRVKQLIKPTPQAWLMNQVYWHSRSVFEHLIEAGAALRTAQLDVLARGATASPPGNARLHQATELHRKAVTDAVHQALRHAATAGLRAQPDALSRSLEALSLAATPPDPRGRLAEVMAPAGLEALTGVFVAAPAPPLDQTTGPSPADPELQPEDSQAVDRRRHDEARAAVEQATIQLAAAREAEQAAVARVEHAERSVRAAEATLQTMRSDLAAAQAAAGDAARARQQAEEALALAKSRMHPGTRARVNPF